jgi:hypothetical protein
MITGTVVVGSSGIAVLLFGPLDADYDVMVTVVNEATVGPVAFAAAPFTVTGAVEGTGGWFVIADALPHKLRIQNGESLYAAQDDNATGNVVTFVGNPI